jgi:hypothetical protein
MKEQNAKGATTAFSTFTPFRSWWARFTHWFVVQAAPVATDQIRRQRVVQHMSFFSVGPGALKRAQMAGTKRPSSGAMLLISAHEGKTEPFIRELSATLAQGMNRLWGGCVGWKGAESYDDVSAFVEAYQRRADLHFNAVALTSSRSRAALRLRAEIDELIALAHRDPSQFLQGYRRAAQVAWAAPPSLDGSV